MNELERLKQRVGISKPANNYADRKLGTYKPYEEDEEEKERKRLESQVEAIKTIAQEQKPIDVDEVDNRYKSHNYREYSLSRIEKDYNKTLVDDINNTIAYKKGLGMTDKEIQEGFIPKNNDPMSRLADIEKKIKQGEERGVYRLQEGYLQKQAQGILSEEANKEANGLPSKRAEVNKWMQDHPELELDTTKDKGFVEKSLDSGIRFMGEMVQMGLEGTKRSVKEPLMWGTVAAIWAGSLMLAPVTGGASLFVPATATAAWLGSATALTALGFGMTAGRTKYMADLEAGLAYNEYVESGVNPEIAKPIAETVGALNGILESMQFETMVKAVPGVNDLAKRTTGLAKNELSKKLLKIGTAYGVDLGGNVLEEMMQESNTNLGATLSAYMQEAPNPNTVDGLKLLTKTMTSEEHLARVAESGVQAAMSMWLMPIGSSVGGYAVNRTITQLEQSAAKKAAYDWYTEEEKQTKAYQDEAKKVLPYAVEVLAKDAADNKSEDSVKGLTAVVTILEEVEKRPDLSNEDKAKISETKQKANEALAKVEYDVKSENPEIELATTNKQEIEQKILSGELPRINTNLTEVVLELRQKAQDKGIYNVIYNGLLEGKRKIEISAEVEKLLPRKERNAIEIMQYINSVEIVEREIKYQFNAAKIANLMSVKDSLKTKAPEQPTTNETEVSQPTDSLDTENLATVNVEPVEGNDTVTPMPKEPLEVNEGKFAPTDAVKVPVKDIHLDPKTFQFRFNGTTNKMEGVQWNDKLAGTILLWENEYGDLYVVNGHHRVMAAKENNVSTLDAKILRGITAQEARAEGAILNIAEGSADAFDTAKFMRDTNSSLEDLTKLGVPPKSKIARDGANLAKLEDNLFYMAAVKKIPYERAVMIGKELGEDKIAQRQFYDMMVKEETKRGYLKDSTIEAMLSQVKSAGGVEYFQESMLGNDARSAIAERAELVSYVKDNLKNKKSVLKKISKAKNIKMLEQLGNKINAEDNVEQMELADQALYLLDKTVNAKDSKVSKMFNELAMEYAKTGDKKMLDQAMKMVGDLMESGELLQEAFGKDKAKEEIVEALEEQIEGQVDLFGMTQIKEMPSIKVKVNKGADKNTQDTLMPLIEIMEKNPMFNGLEIIFTGQSSDKFMDRSELDAKGYHNAREGIYRTYGWYESLSRANRISERDDAERTNQGNSTGDQLRDNRDPYKTGTRGRIFLNNSAQVDTLLHETIHSIQDILYDVDPEFAVLVAEWEKDINAEAEKQGIVLPQGREMLTHALMLGEFGYADDDMSLANTVAVPKEIVKQFRDMLGKDFVDEAMGENLADAERKLKADWKKYADGNLKTAELTENVARAKQRRISKIKMDLKEGIPTRYYSPDSTTYAIAMPKGTEYEVSFFNEQGLLTKAKLSINELAKKLSDMKLYYNPSEINYQLKQWNRDQIDDVVIGKPINDPSEIVRAFENARIGNFTASDYDNYVKDMLNEADKQDLLKAIMNAAEKGLDKPNSEVTIQEYVNRFYPQRIEPNDYGMRERDGKIEFFYKAYDEMSPYRSDEIVPIKVLGTFDSVTEAIKAYRDWTYLNRDLSAYKDKAFNKQFYYMPDYWDQLVQEYEDFKANYETYRHDYSTDFDGQPKFNVSYQIKKGLSDTKRINPEAGEILTVVYKGFKDGETKRIKTGNSQWDSFFFVADNPLDASLYGNTLEEYSVSPKAKILYEGTKEFSAISKHKKNETMLEWSSRIANTAKEQGYDAVWFKRQGEIGTAIINRDILDLPSERINYQVKQAADINTEEFRTFFGESKVVTDTNKPMRMYHGTYDAIFDVFDMDKANPYSLFGAGFYFSSDKSISDSYANITKRNRGIKSLLPKGKTEWDVYDLFDIIDAGENLLMDIRERNNITDKSEDYLQLLKSNADDYELLSGINRLIKYGITEYDLTDSTQERYFKDYEYKSRYLTFKYFKKGYVMELYALHTAISDDPNVMEAFKSKGIEFDIQMEKPGVYEVYLSIQNPFDADGMIPTDVVKTLDRDTYDGENSLKTWGMILEEDFADDPDAFYNEYPSPVPNSLTNILYFLSKGNRSQQKVINTRMALKDVLMSYGYDGITHVGGKHIGDKEHRVFIAFKPTQIKSIYNNGQFSLYDPNINYQLKREEEGISQYSLGNINNFVEAEENKDVAYSDTVDLFNNKVLSVKGEVSDRLMPFIKYDAVMGGYDAIKINGEEPVLITNEEILEVMERGQPLFQIKELVAVHNLSEGQLKSTVKLGGIVMPSIAVTLKNYLHDRYGEISLLFNKNTIDPRANKDNRVYSGDAYTPEFPSIRYKINDKEARTLRDRVKSALAGTQYMNEYRDTIDATNIEDRVNREGSFEGAYKYDPLLMLTYLKEKGIEFEPVMRTKNYEFDVPLMEQLQAIEGELINKQYLESAEIEQLDSKFREAINKFYGVNLYKEAIGYGKMDRLHDNIREFSKDTTRETIDGRATETKLQETIDHADYTKWFNEVSKDIIEAEGIRNNRDIFTNSGTRRGWNALHDPVTLDNILKAMKAESETASGMLGGVGRFGAAVSRKFTSIADIKAAVDRLSTMDEEVYNAMREDFQERLIELASRIKDNRESNRFIAIDHAFDAMVDAFSNGKGRSGIVKILNEYPGLNITEDAIDEMMQLADEVAQMPTEYFEAKPRRIVGLEEIQAVIMPLDTDPELVQMLRDRGIHLIEFYDKTIEGDRQRAMDEVLGKNDVSFQIKPESPWNANTIDEYYQLKDNPEMEERSWSQTVRDANLTQEWLRDMLTDRKMMYEVAHNEDSMIAGAKLIDERGIEYIEARLDNDFEATPDVMAAGMILIYYYQESGDRPSTHDMVAKVAKKATTAGQAIQILSYLNRESPEGILRFTRKEFDKQSTSRQRKTLEELTKKVEEEAKKVNSETVDTVDVEGLVKKVQDMTQEELDTIEIAQDDQKTQDFMEGKEVETNQKSTVEPEVIAQVIKDHYKGDGKRSLVSRLRNAGMNPTEAKLLSDSIEAEMLNATDAKVQEILDRLSTGKAKAVDKSIKTLISQGRYGEALKLKLGQKKGVPVLTDEMADMVYQRAEEISKMPEGREKNVQLALLLRDIDAEMPVGLAGKITTFRIMMMLLNAVTMLRNIIGNLGFGAVDTFALNVVGAEIDKLYAKNSGFRTTLNRGLDVLSKQWQGYGTGGRIAYEDAKLGIDTNRDISRMELGKTGRTFARGTVLGSLETALNIGLRVPDAAAMYATSFDTIQEQIEIAGVAEPTQEMLDIAHNLGLYRTFNDDSLMSEAFKTIKNGLNIVGTKSIKYAQKKGYSDNAKWTQLFGPDPTRGSFGFGDIVLPFTKTVANLTQRAIDYSPAGVILTMAKLYLDHSQSDYVRQRMKVEAIARGITGTALIGTGMLLAQLGVIRGGDPEDEDKDVLELQKQAGLRPYTINLSAISRVLRNEKNAGDLRPGDQLATYDWLQPGALTIAIGADIATGDGDTFNLINTLVRAMEVGSETVTGQPLLQNVTKIFEWGINRGLTNTLKSLPASFIPSVLGRVAQAADGGATDPYSYFSEGRQAWNLIANKLVGDLEVNGVPLGRGAIPDKIDIMGEPIKWYGTDDQFTKYLQALFSPAIMTDYTPTEEMQFLIDLTIRTGDSTIIQMPQRTFTEKGVSYEPTPEQFEAMSIYYGKALQQDIKSLMQYGKGRDDDWLAKEVANIVRDIKGEVKFKFIRGDFD